MENVTICVLSCGEETESECYKALQVFEGKVIFQQVKNVFPQIKALTQMVDQCNTEYLIPVDADMILYPDAYDRIKQAIDKFSHDLRWHSILFRLWDRLTEQSILALKILRMSVFKKYPFFDSPTPDVGHFKLLTDAGYTCVTRYLDKSPIGDHVVKGPYFCYHKYRDVYMTLRKYKKEWDVNLFKGGRTIAERSKKHFDFFVYKYLMTNNKDYLYCIAGMIDGLTADQEDYSKSLEKRPYNIAVETAIDCFIEWHKKRNIYLNNLSI